jgi:hypothetical protein
MHRSTQRALDEVRELGTYGAPRAMPTHRELDELMSAAMPAQDKA